MQFRRPPTSEDEPKGEFLDEENTDEDGRLFTAVRFVELLSSRPDCDIILGSRVKLLGNEIDKASQMTEYRGLVKRVFTAGRVRAMEPETDRIIAETIDGFVFAVEHKLVAAEVFDGETGDTGFD